MSNLKEKVLSVEDLTNEISLTNNNLKSKFDGPFLQKHFNKNGLRMKAANDGKKIIAIENVLKENLYNSLAQAIIKIIQTPHIILKIFLCIFSLASTSLASYLVIQSIVTYFMYEASTTSRTIYENPTPFPKVTFCNVNSFTTEYGYNLSQSRVFNFNDLSIGEKQKLGHDLRDILIECSFYGNKCTSNDFIWSYDASFGNCYTFNTGYYSNGTQIDIKQLSVAGVSFGLSLMLYVNFDEKLLENVPSINGLGALIRIDNSSYSKFYLDTGILVSAGFQTNIAVEREFKQMLPKPYSNCEVEPNSSKFKQGLELYNLIGQTKYAYSQQLCIFQCIQRESIKKYNCTLSYITSLFNASACNFSFKEFRSALDNITKSGEIFHDICLPLCPLECNQTLYKTSISSFSLYGTKYLSTIQRNPNLASDFLKRTLDSITATQSFVKLNVFYESLSYTISTETSKIDVISLLASIGGNLGLFLGVSVFSLCEIFEAFIEIFFILMVKNKANVEASV
jgi:hypothetical protein